MFSTFAEQRHFIYPSKDTYTGVFINGNMAVHAPDGLAAFLLEKTANQVYLIDPMTHAFQHDPAFVQDDRGKPKSSILGLAEIYGEPFVSLVGQRPLLPELLEDGELFAEFVERCLRFQETILANAMKEADAIKYFIEPPNLSPQAFIPPYFLLSGHSWERWLPLMLKGAQVAKDILVGRKLFVAVVISRSLLADNDATNQIAEQLRSLDVGGFVLWVDNFDEQGAGLQLLQKLLSFASLLRNGGRREVINLHGGYFSILAAGQLGRRIFTGVTHAPEFGEYRAVVPVGGGIPIARYYVPHLHSRERYRDTQALFQRMGALADAQTFHEKICDCDECKATLEGDVANFVRFGAGKLKEMRRGSGTVRIDFPTTETKLRCLRHYLNCKAREYAMSDSASGSDLILDLKEGEERYRSMLGMEGVEHLYNWRRVFELAG